MEEKKKSKIIVVGFVLFVLGTYTASYFYTKSNNERLLSAPRTVILLGSEKETNNLFTTLTLEQRRILIRNMVEERKIFTISQTQFEELDGDVHQFMLDKFYPVTVASYASADCLEYSETLKRTMAKEEKITLKASWIFTACGLIE